MSMAIVDPHQCLNCGHGSDRHIERAVTLDTIPRHASHQFICDDCGCDSDRYLHDTP